MDDVSLTAEPGSVVGLIGPNGSGKTTTLDAISGNVHLHAGSVRVNGEEVTDYLPEERIAVGVVRSFQDCRLFPELTVEDILMVSEDARQPVGVVSSTLQAPWARRAERRKRQDVNRVIEAFGLWGDSATTGPPSCPPGPGGWSTWPRSCSPPRACCCSTSRPPASPSARPRRSLPLLRRLREVADCTIVLVEHDVGLVFDLCSQVVVLEAGKVVSSGTPDEVSRDPRALAAYLGASAEALAVTGPTGHDGGAKDGEGEGAEDDGGDGGEAGDGRGLTEWRSCELRWAIRCTSW